MRRFFSTRARRVGALVAVLLVAGLVVTYVLLRQTSSPAQRIADAEPPPAAVATAKVQDRVLQESVQLQGWVTAGTSQDVGVPGVPGGSRAVVTTASPDVGATLKAGGLLFAVSGEPVFVLAGPLPLYRAITPGMKGPDVASLQTGLRSAGHSISDADGFYGWSTQQAVTALWKASGFTPPHPEGIQERLDAARQAVNGAADAAARAEAMKNLRATQADDGPVVTPGSVVMVAALPVTVVSSRASSGAVLTGGSAVTLAAGAPVVSLTATTAQASRIRAGGSVELKLPDGSTVKGKVVSLSGVAQPGGGAPASASGSAEANPDGPSTGSETSPETSSAPSGAGSAGATPIDPSSAAGIGAPGQPTITVQPDEALPVASVGRPVSAKLVFASTGQKVTAVPVSAIRTRDDGSTGVVAAGGSNHRWVNVTVGPTIGGWVQITGSDPKLEPGDTVVVGQSR